MIADATLNRFFAFHVIAIPLILVVLVFLHIVAFASVEYIMRDVDFGWLIRYMHSTGASMFLIN